MTTASGSNGGSFDATTYDAEIESRHAESMTIAAARHARDHGREPSSRERSRTVKRRQGKTRSEIGPCNVVPDVALIRVQKRPNCT